MSHGTQLQDCKLGVDGETINIEEGAKSLFSNQNCPSLKDKSKLFFVDACWGEGLMEIAGYNMSKNSSDISHACHICNTSYSSISSPANNPDISDFLYGSGRVNSRQTLASRVLTREQQLSPAGARHRWSCIRVLLLSCIWPYGDSMTNS